MENSLNLNKFQIAAARRAYQSEKMSIRQLRKVEAKIEKLMNEKATLLVGIEAFDAPIKAFTGGIGAEETLRILGILKEEGIEEAAPAMEVETPQTEEEAQTFPVSEVVEEKQEEKKEMPEWMRIAEEELK